ncbi:MAG: hypothetical protein ACFE91_05510 [Promethearchaeota archaeon]
MPRRKQKIKYSRKIVCKHLEPKGDISNSLQSLCFCPTRDLVLGNRAYVCQVCSLYDAAKNNRRFSELYEESKKMAEKKIQEKKIKLEEFEIAEIKSEDEIDLSIDEFEEEDEEIPLKFEKRKAGKADLEGSDAFETTNECPFCGDFFEDLSSHIQTCEFAPDDASLDDIIPSRKKKVKKKKASTESEKERSTEKQKCPYCKKEFIRLGRHISSCPEKPSDADDSSDSGEDEE